MYNVCLIIVFSHCDWLDLSYDLLEYGPIHVHVDDLFIYYIT